MAEHTDVIAVLNRCAAVESQTLEEFLDNLLDTDLETLAQLPGSPGQVLSAQFTYYARSAVTLAEPLRRKTDLFKELEDALLRLQPETKATKKRKVASHADPPRAQAAAGS